MACDSDTILMLNDVECKLLYFICQTVVASELTIVFSKDHY